MKKSKFLKTLLITTVVCGISSAYAESKWPPETGAKVKGNALEYPTTLEAANNSLSYYLNKNATITSTQVTDRGPVFTLKQDKKNLICFVYPIDQVAGKETATSKCYKLN